MQNIEKGLEVLGLDEKEIKVILGLNTSDTISASALSRRIRLPRTTVSYILSQLKKRGFTERVYIGNHQEWRLAPYSVFREKLRAALKIFEEK